MVVDDVRTTVTVRPCSCCSLSLLTALRRACAGDVSDPFGPSEEEQESIARVEYWENAAVTYYDGGRYDLAAMQFRSRARGAPQRQEGQARPRQVALHGCRGQPGPEPW